MKTDGILIIRAENYFMTLQFVQSKFTGPQQHSVESILVGISVTNKAFISLRFLCKVSRLLNDGICVVMSYVFANFFQVQLDCHNPSLFIFT